MADIRFALLVGKNLSMQVRRGGWFDRELEFASSGSIGLGQTLLHPEIEPEILATQLAGISIFGSLQKGGPELDLSHNEWEPYGEKFISAPSKYHT